MKRIKSRATSLVMSMLFLTSMCNLNIYAADQSAVRISETFVAESEYSVERDSIGEVVITLTNEEQLSQNVRSGVTNFAKTSIVILPEDENQAAEIISNIESLQRGSGSHTSDDWFYGSSVYLKSTVNYTTSVGSDGLTYGRITNVKISATTNSGSSISSMSLLMGQNGYASGGYKTQRITFNATTARSFNAPSSWASILWNGSGSAGGNLTCTAVRQGGQSTFTLINNVQ